MKKVLTNPTVLVAALGYFVDMFDLTLFGVLRVASLKGIGITEPDQILSSGILLLNLQMIGMLIGGVAWGIMGDKRGRLSVLFGSILLYSIANIANAFATNLTSYAILRFFVGFGLAGELGAAITLVSEVLDKDVRGYGTTLVATLGLLGAVAAAMVGQSLPWNWAYIIGGLMGLSLLVARFSVMESSMFSHVETKKRGDIRLLFRLDRFTKYLSCILMAIPIWFVTGILMTFSPEITKDFNFSAPITAGNALMYCSIGLTIGDLLSGVLSQILKKRKLAVGVFLGLTAVLIVTYFNLQNASADLFYLVCLGLGICAGYWAVFVTIAAEQFGTNLRATVATSAPNFVRGSLVILTTVFAALKVSMGVKLAAASVGIVVFVLAVVALISLPETYGKDLDYLES